MPVETGFAPTGDVHVGDQIALVVSADDASLGQETTVDATFRDELSQFTGVSLGTFVVDAAGNVSGSFAVPDVRSGFYGSGHNFGVYLENISGNGNYFLGGLHVLAPVPTAAPANNRLSLGIGIGL